MITTASASASGLRTDADVRERREARRPDAVLARTTALRLAMGAAPHRVLDAEAWREALDAATEERFAPLAWLRSSSLIRALAPGDVSQRWRAVALAAAARAAADWSSLVELCTALQARDIQPVILKGAPLAVRLYGQIAARPASDIDIFVAPRDRRQARRVMRDLGWRHVEGEPPWDESLVRASGRGEQLLEVHSSLLHPRLAYLRLGEPDAEAMVIEGVPVRVHGGPSLAGYLAVHLATHQFIPLLWWLDLATLWGAMDAAARADAERAATRAGAHRYLRWALRRVHALERLADGDASEGRLLGLAAGRRSAEHPMWRHLRLAPSVGARRTALLDWLWPSWMRETYGASPLGFARRLARNASALVPRRRPLA